MENCCKIKDSLWYSMSSREVRVIIVSKKEGGMRGFFIQSK